MNSSHLLLIFTTETQKLYRRVTSWIGLALCVLFGVIAPVILFLINGQIDPAQAVPDPSAGGMQASMQQIGSEYSVQFSFALRGFFVLPILIFIMAGSSFADEFRQRAIREYALRPVPRIFILAAKWLALCLWTLVAALITFTVSLALGVVLLGLPGAEDATLMQRITEDLFPAYVNLGTAIVADMGFATIALAVAIFTRSIAATIAILIMTFVAQIGAAIVLSTLSSDQFQAFAVQFLPQQLRFIEQWFGVADYLVLLQPPLVVGALCGWTSTWHSYASLAVIAVTSMALSTWRFQRMDIP